MNGDREYANFVWCFFFFSSFFPSLQPPEERSASVHRQATARRENTPRSEGLRGRGVARRSVRALCCCARNPVPSSEMEALQLLLPFLS